VCVLRVRQRAHSNRRVRQRSEVAPPSRGGAGWVHGAGYPVGTRHVWTRQAAGLASLTRSMPWRVSGRCAGGPMRRPGPAVPRLRSNAVGGPIFFVRPCLVVKLDAGHCWSKTTFFMAEVSRAKSDSSARLHTHLRLIALLYPEARVGSRAGVSMIAIRIDQQAASRLGSRCNHAWMTDSDEAPSVGPRRLLSAWCLHSRGSQARQEKNHLVLMGKGMPHGRNDLSSKRRSRLEAGDLASTVKPEVRDICLANRLGT
jgi:hypothetical protein